MHFASFLWQIAVVMLVAVMWELTLVVGLTAVVAARTGNPMSAVVMIALAAVSARLGMAACELLPRKS